MRTVISGICNVGCPDELIEVFAEIRAPGFDAEHFLDRLGRERPHTLLPLELPVRASADHPASHAVVIASLSATAWDWTFAAALPRNNARNGLSCPPLRTSFYAKHHDAFASTHAAAEAA